MRLPPWSGAVVPFTHPAEVTAPVEPTTVPRPGALHPQVLQLLSALSATPGGLSLSNRPQPAIAAVEACLTLPGAESVKCILENCCVAEGRRHSPGAARLSWIEASAFGFDLFWLWIKSRQLQIYIRQNH